MEVCLSELSSLPEDPTNFIFILPEDIWARVLSDLPFITITAVLCSCKTLSGQLDHNTFFKMLYYLKFGVRKKRSGKGQKKKKRRAGEKQVWKTVFRDNFSQIQSADLRAMRTWVDIPETTRKLVWQKYFFNVIHAYERGLNSSAGCVVTDLDWIWEVSTNTVFVKCRHGRRYDVKVFTLTVRCECCQWIHQAILRLSQQDNDHFFRYPKYDTFLCNPIVHWQGIKKLRSRNPVGCDHIAWVWEALPVWKEGGKERIQCAKCHTFCYIKATHRQTLFSSFPHWELDELLV
eukprot:TRINITY_DN2645_c0_g1_i17.p1 TRINITY_DN2645_c0_g1~~TRINITY_DN2645_c0_g1_i17.p1  ORF type:complete len:290 (-),score=25.20 TRINITY_DN2645_c0_g1_i17:108-977(-)